MSNRKSVVCHHGNDRAHIFLLTLQNLRGFGWKFWSIKRISWTICCGLCENLLIVYWLENRLVKITCFGFSLRNLRCLQWRSKGFTGKVAKDDRSERQICHWWVFKIYFNQFILKKLKKDRNIFFANPTVFI